MTIALIALASTLLSLAWALARDTARLAEEAAAIGDGLKPRRGG